MNTEYINTQAEAGKYAGCTRQYTKRTCPVARCCPTARLPLPDVCHVNFPGSALWELRRRNDVAMVKEYHNLTGPSPRDRRRGE